MGGWITERFDSYAEFLGSQFQFPVAYAATAAPAAAGASWTQVRHIPAASATWYTAADNLAGTSTTGVSSDDAAEWSEAFEDEEYTEVLFSLDDGSKWMIVPAEQLKNMAPYKNQVLESSTSAYPYEVQFFWDEAASVGAAPIIGLTDHLGDVSDATDILYAEDSTARNVVSIASQGANMYIRKNENSNTDYTTYRIFRGGNECDNHNAVIGDLTASTAGKCIEELRAHSVNANRRAMIYFDYNHSNQECKQCDYTSPDNEGSVLQENSELATT